MMAMWSTTCGSGSTALPSEAGCVSDTERNESRTKQNVDLAGRELQRALKCQDLLFDVLARVRE